MHSLVILTGIGSGGISI